MSRRYTPVRIVTFVAALCLIVVLRYFIPRDATPVPDRTPPSEVSPPAATGEGERALLDALENRRSGVMVDASGVVQKVLPDDEEGSRHQRLIVRLDAGHTVLIAHNIDLATRVPVARGERIEFKGQYEWNEKGGVVHWTHHDPQRRHPGGWIKHEGRKYD